MTPASRGPLAFGGAPLQGSELVRIAYMDEAGISTHEPAVVVASIIIDGDRQYRAVREDLAKIVEKYIPKEDRDNFVFHATELFSGGKYFDRDKWPRERRWEILREILGLVPRYDIQICLCFLSRSDALKSGAEVSIKLSDEQLHALAFVYCTVTIDQWMRKNAADEFTILVAEDANKTKNKLKRAYHYISNQSKMMEIQKKMKIPTITRIVDTPHFVKKTESSILQIVDAWAFIIRRHLLKKPDVKYFDQPMDAAKYHMVKFSDTVLVEPSS